MMPCVRRITACVSKALTRFLPHCRKPRGKGTETNQNKMSEDSTYRVQSTEYRQTRYLVEPMKRIKRDGLVHDARPRPLVEPLHRPPAVGVRQPRRPLLLLVLHPLLVAVAVGALGGVAVGRAAAVRAGRHAPCRGPVHGPHVLEQPPRRRLLLLLRRRGRQGRAPLRRRRRVLRASRAVVVVVREARGLGQPLVLRQRHDLLLLRRALPVRAGLAAAHAVHEQQLVVAPRPRLPPPRPEPRASAAAAVVAPLLLLLVVLRVIQHAHI
ncbi:hypothetical protein D1007_04061 [Hordeum vulgare]|nr:hypothetical protein D1007_04061 [Hordeum vulgare]